MVGSCWRLFPAGHRPWPLPLGVILGLQLRALQEAREERAFQGVRKGGKRVMCTGSVNMPTGSHPGMLVSRCHLSHGCPGAHQHRDKHLLTHITHTDNSHTSVRLCPDSGSPYHFPLSSTPLILLPFFNEPHPLSSGLSFLCRQVGIIRGLVVLVLGEEPGPSGGHHGVGLKAPSTALIRIACSLSNCNKKQLSWKPALDVVQISECLPSPHLGYFPSFLVFPLRLLLLVWQEYVGPQLSEDCGSQPVSTMWMPF